MWSLLKSQFVHCPCCDYHQERTCDATALFKRKKIIVVTKYTNAQKYTQMQFLPKKSSVLFAHNQMSDSQRISTSRTG